MSVRNYVIGDQGERYRHYLDIFARKPPCGLRALGGSEMGRIPTSHLPL